MHGEIGLAVTADIQAAREEPVLSRHSLVDAGKHGRTRHCRENAQFVASKIIAAHRFTTAAAAYRTRAARAPIRIDGQGPRVHHPGPLFSPV
jgi:hypothetical protein